MGIGQRKAMFDELIVSLPTVWLENVIIHSKELKWKLAPKYWGSGFTYTVHYISSDSKKSWKNYLKKKWKFEIILYTLYR